MAHGFTKDYPQTEQATFKVFVNGTQQSTGSGSTWDFTIPSGVKRVRVSWQGVDPTSTTSFGVQLEDSTSLKTSGYLGKSTYLSTSVQGIGTITSHIGFGSWGAAMSNMIGAMELVLHDEATNHWIGTALGAGYGTTDYTIHCAGEIALDGELTGIRFLAGAPATGTVNIQYDNPDTITAETVYTTVGGIVQVQRTDDHTYQTTTTAMPYDDTIPQNTEGGEFMTVSITPKKATNKLRIQVLAKLNHSSASAGAMVGAIFQDSTANALAAGWTGRETVAYQPCELVLDHWMDAGTTSSTTFKFRAGGNLGATCVFNGNASGRLMGGVCNSYIMVTEYEVT